MIKISVLYSLELVTYRIHVPMSAIVIRPYRSGSHGVSSILFRSILGFSLFGNGPYGPLLSARTMQLP